MFKMRNTAQSEVVDGHHLGFIGRSVKSMTHQILGGDNMEGNLIENNVQVFYTVEVNEGLYVESSNIFSNEDKSVIKVTSVMITQDKRDKYHYTNLDIAKAIAKYVKGKVIEHTRTTITTETTRELPLEEE